MAPLQDNQSINLPEALKFLHEEGLTSILVEGGSTVQGSFFDARLVDKVYAFMGDKVIGGVGALPSVGGYGVDDWCDKAEKLILELAQCPQGKVYFFPGATQANFVTISALLGSCDSVICADTGHINCHECASIENTGHKIVALPHHDGKITADQIEGEVQAYYNSGEANT